MKLVLIGLLLIVLLVIYFVCLYKVEKRSEDELKDLQKERDINSAKELENFRKQLYKSDDQPSIGFVVLISGMVRNDENIDYVKNLLKGDTLNGPDRRIAQNFINGVKQANIEL
jgi:hypothetical protein